jgi:group II intron reverse transcriptase/maturase
MGNTKEASDSQIVSTRQRRIAELANQMGAAGISSLNHHVDLVWMREAYRRTRKDGAVGVDGQTAEEYEQDLEGNLLDLIERAKSGRYFAPPVKRGYVPKNEREDRPIGIPTLEDKVLQRAGVMLMEPIYEQTFLDCSYGFRPKRRAHDALEALWQAITSMKGCWILEADFRKFFDSVDRNQTQEFVRKRVRDGVVCRLIGKWLNAGVMEEGELFYPEAGTPQGGVISPLLSNIYLHEVVDQWFESEVKPHLRGRSFVIRFADDFVMGFELEEDAQRVRNVLWKRCERFHLTLHPEKTRVLDFRRPGAGKKGATFDFLGFRHYWGQSHKGYPVVKRKTMDSRLTRSLKAVGQWCRGHRHEPLAEQRKALLLKLRGHYGYYGITGNAPRLQSFYRGVCRLWYKWLKRRSRKRDLTWDRFNRLLGRYALPLPRVVHSIYRATGESPP